MDFTDDQKALACACRLQGREAPPQGLFTYLSIMHRTVFSSFLCSVCPSLTSCVMKVKIITNLLTVTCSETDATPTLGL